MRYELGVAALVIVGCLVRGQVSKVNNLADLTEANNGVYQLQGTIVAVNNGSFELYDGIRTVRIFGSTSPDAVGSPANITVSKSGGTYSLTKIRTHQVTNLKAEFTQLRIHNNQVYGRTENQWLRVH